MHRTRLEKLTEVVLGEAVLALLDSETRIGADTVRDRLSAMIKREPDPERQQAIGMALAEMQAEFNFPQGVEAGIHAQGADQPAEN